jgi:hypothetical protein
MTQRNRDLSGSIQGQTEPDSASFFARFFARAWLVEAHVIFLTTLWVMVLNRNPPKTKPAPFSLTENVGFVRFYLDDLDTLVRFVRSHANGFVVIGAERATADEANDLRSATPEELRAVTVVSEKPSMAIVLHEKQAVITTTEDSDPARDLVSRTAALVRGHRRGASGPMVRSFGWALGGFFYAILLVATAASLFSKGDGSGWVWVVLSVILVPASLAFSIAVWRWRKRRGGAAIIPMNREEDRSRRTGWRVGLVTTVLGALVGSGLTLAMQYLAGL